MQQHRAVRVAVDAGAADDGQPAVAGVVEGPLDRDLAIVELVRPAALPLTAGRVGADAVALVTAHLAGVARIEQQVRERELVALRVALRRQVDDVLVDRVLDQVQRRPHLLRRAGPGRGHRQPGAAERHSHGHGHGDPSLVHDSPFVVVGRTATLPYCQSAPDQAHGELTIGIQTTGGNQCTVGYVQRRSILDARRPALLIAAVAVLAATGCAGSSSSSSGGSGPTASPPSSSAPTTGTYFPAAGTDKSGAVFQTYTDRKLGYRLL